MARFSEQFLQSLTQPSFGQGLFQVGQAVGQIPTTTRTMQQKREKKETLAGFDPNTVEGLAGLATFYQSQGQLDKAVEYATAARTLRDQLETKQKATEKEEEKEESRARLLGIATKKAAEEEDPATAVGRVREMTLEQLMEYLTPKERDTTVISAGGILADTDTGEILAKAPFKQQNTLFNDLLKSGKYDPTTVKRDAEGNVDTSALRLAKDPKERGSIPANVEKRIIDMDVDSEKATIAFGRARKLKEDLMASPDKKAGIVSDLRTQVLDFAGLRDAEEERKTKFLRTRNTDIINSLPPGIASDTDVRIFSQGFPSGDATTEEIIRYLEAEEKILAAQSDMSALFQQHINKQVENGIEATTSGFEYERRKYANVMTEFRNKVENATDQQGNPLYSEEDKKRFLQEALGFVPTYYSR